MFIVELVRIVVVSAPAPERAFSAPGAVFLSSAAPRQTVAPPTNKGSTSASIYVQCTLYNVHTLMVTGQN